MPTMGKQGSAFKHDHGSTFRLPDLLFNS